MGQRFLTLIPSLFVFTKQYIFFCSHSITDVLICTLLTCFCKEHHLQFCPQNAHILKVPNYSTFDFVSSFTLKGIANLKTLLETYSNFT